MAAIDGGIILQQRLVILDVQMANLSDRADSETHEIPIGMRRIALKAPMQGAVLPGDRETVLGKSEMIHPDVDVSRRAELIDRQLQQSKSRSCARKIARTDLPLGLEQLRHVGIPVHCQAIRTHFDDAVESVAESRHSLARQTVDEIE